jgi:hypothetical protein
MRTGIVVSGDDGRLLLLHALFRAYDEIKKADGHGEPGHHNG